MSIYQEVELSELNESYDIDFLIITATTVELNAAIEFLTPIEDDILQAYYNANTYYIGLFGNFICAIVKTNSMGAISSGASLQTTQESIAALTPKAIIMGGIALGKEKDKQKLGDILVSKSVVFYEQARVNDNGSIEYRGIKPEANRTLINRLTQNSTHDYLFNNKNKDATVISGPILSGEKLIDNNQFKQKLLSHFPDAIGGEMEAHGVYVACHDKNVPWIIVKTICDWADGHKEKSFQSESAYIAFSFIHRALESKFAFSNLKILPFKKKRDSPEVNLDAINILPLLVSRRDLSKVLSNREIIKDSSKKVYYEYFFFENRGRVEGFLFIGKNVTITNTLDSFVSTFEKPKILNVYVTKKYNATGPIDRISHLNKETAKRQLSATIYDGIQYLEETIWDSTFKSYDDTKHHKRSDYIDQSLYTYHEDDTNLGHGTEYFKSILADKMGSSISIIFGSGGVGKTTLCDALKSDIERDSDVRKKGVFLIRGERTSSLKNFHDIYVESLLDLFEAFKEESNLSNLSTNDFSINYACGNIQVIIDGLDEIDSALGERFNLERFFQSLSDLDERFHNTKIILTTRDYFAKNLVSSSPLIKKFKLNGFTEGDIEKFKKIKLKTDSQRTKFDKLLESKKLRKGSFSLPVIINLACQAVLGDGPHNKSYNENSEYLISDHVYDSILDYMLNREIEKQKINCTVDDLFLLLVEIVTSHNNKISTSELKEYVELSFNETVNKFLRNPIFSVTSDFISIKEEALCSLVRCRYARYLLLKNISLTEKISELLKDSYKGNGEIYSSLVDTIDTNNEKFIENSTKLLKQMSHKESHSTSNYEKSKYKKSISAMLYILMSNRNCDNKPDRSNFLLQIKGSTTNTTSIDGLHIYGEFHTLDFSNITITNSYFSEFEKFEDCIFPSESKVVFSYCEFNKITLKKANNIKTDIFEASCKFEDCNIMSEIKNQQDDDCIKQKRVRDNIVSISRYIDTTQRSSNLIKLNTSVKWSKSHKGFLKSLISESFLEFTNKGLYKINHDYYDNLPDIKLGRFPDKLDEIVAKLAKK
ncbi:Nucleoside phosphorylase-like protein [Shewanella sediminis HAW-EB3]|uniref:Nucleoside phosphorylase-like protein n=1 Tax=Shewanella sediminis (strain HAW-EB3) TaxID=425104 RepID=A8FZI9_SHESH|nr:NACHT domain-containing protein [Shewanella sediminis]ABV38262.1 Nucleoside phosphorylase-like protein [Shewanella sediminis HAW-EB3]